MIPCPSDNITYSKLSIWTYIAPDRNIASSALEELDIIRAVKFIDSMSELGRESW